MDLKELLEGKKYPIDLIIVILWSIIAVVGALALPDGNILRVILGIPLIIFLPGYALVSFLWPERSVEEINSSIDSEEGDEKSSSFKGIDDLERIALGFGLSVAVLPLIGLAINYLWEMSFVPILVSMLLFIIIIEGLAWLRRRELLEEERFSVSFPINLKSAFGGWAQADKIVALVLAVSLIVAGSILAYIVMIPDVEERLTEFYLLDENHTLENLPINLTVNETGSIIIVVVCHEYEKTDYSVSVNILNVTGERQNRTLYVYNIFLEHKEDNETKYEILINETGEYKLKLELYKNYEEDSPYRYVYLWIRVENSPS